MHMLTVNILQTVTDRASIAMVNKFRRIRPFDCNIYIWPLTQSKGQGPSYAHFDGNYQKMVIIANITIAIK